MKERNRAWGDFWRWVKYDWAESVILSVRTGWKEAESHLADSEDSERGVAGKEAGWSQMSVVKMRMRQLRKVLVLALPHLGILSVSSCYSASLSPSKPLSATFYVSHSQMPLTPEKALWSQCLSAPLPSLLASPAASSDSKDITEDSSPFSLWNGEDGYCCC